MRAHIAFASAAGFTVLGFLAEETIVNGVNDKGQLVGFYANTDGAAVNGFLANPAQSPRPGRDRPALWALACSDIGRRASKFSVRRRLSKAGRLPA
jgi:hypothetical protein